MILNSWSAYGSLLWDVGAAKSPPTEIRVLPPISHDGTSKPVFHRFDGLNGYTIVKKASEDRVKELLGIMNYLAAPFGTEEYQLIYFGREGSDFSFDSGGNPVLTDAGKANTHVAWSRISCPKEVLYDPQYPDFVKQAYSDDQATVPYLIDDPSVGLYSETYQNGGIALSQRFADSVGDIIVGRASLSSYDTVLSDWKSQGGDKIKSEFEKAYADAH
jgi:putative aldouronate transport system substrate-binding protein